MPLSCSTAIMDENRNGERARGGADSLLAEAVM